MTRKLAQTKRSKVLGYIRVSSASQVADGESLERQEEQIRAFCARKGIQDGNLEIIADKGVSGFKSSRPGFQRLIQQCEAGDVAMVVIYDLSRLSRSVRDTLAFVEDQIQKNQIEFASIQQDLDTSTPMGKAFLGFLAVFNQLYRDEIAFKTKAALKHKRGKGERLGGTIPFGYSLVEGSRLQAAPEELQTIRFIHRLRRQGMSLRAIIAELHRNGIKTKTGKEKWSPQVVQEILRRQISAITHDPTLPDATKDAILSDVAAALYDAEDLAAGAVAPILEEA